MMKFSIVALAVAAPLVFAAGTLPAAAAGCGGTVNLAKWGCAPWDNNDKNGKPIKVQPKQPVETVVYRAPVQTHDYSKDPKGPYNPSQGGWVGTANSPLTAKKK